MQNPPQRLSASEHGSASCVDGVQLQSVGTVQINTRKESKKFIVYSQHAIFLIEKEIMTKSMRRLSACPERKRWKPNEGKQIMKKTTLNVSQRKLSAQLGRNLGILQKFSEYKRWTARHRKHLEWEQPSPASIYYFTAQH